MLNLGRVRVLLLVVTMALASIYLACEPPVARITELASGKVLDVQIPNIKSQGGNISGTASDGEQFTGSFAVVPEKPTGRELVMKVISAVAWDQGHTDLSANLDGIPDREEYTATLSGNRGTVIDLVFAINTRSCHGSGTGKDNKGGNYRIQL